MKYIFMLLAIILEVVATGFLKASEGFTRLVPTVVTAVGYLLCFYFLSLALKSIPLGVAYATWAGLGIILTAVVGVVIFKQQVDTPAIIGIVLIVAGVLVINFMSKTAGH